MTSQTNQRTEFAPVTINDYKKTVEPGAAKLSPDGRHIGFVHEEEAYVLLADGKDEPLKLSKAGEGYTKCRPVWSRDGKKLILLFYSSKRKAYEIYAVSPDDSETWEMLGQMSAEVWDLNLSPDQSRWLFSSSETPKTSHDDPKDPGSAPIVIDAMVFKQDGKGYVATEANNSIYTWDLSTSSPTQLSDGTGHDTQPAWSPDGTKVAFIRENLSEPEYHCDLCVVPSDGTGTLMPTVLASSPADRQSPAWSPDGKTIAYIRKDAKKGPYAVGQLAVLSIDNGRERVLTKKHDRTITSFMFSHDGRFIYFLYDNKGGRHLARIRLSSQQIDKLVSGECYVTDFDLSVNGQLALNMKNMNDAAEIHFMKNDVPVARTEFNQGFFGKRKLGAKEQLFYTAKSGESVQALITKPVDFDPSKKYPTVLRIHGGPVQQATFGYDFFSQLLAASGYVVVEPNPPGSTGRGQKFIEAVKDNWGFTDEPDVLGAIDEVVRLGYADPDNLAVMGYSYGGYLTNCIITLTPRRFKTAVSGAGHSLIGANYGHDTWLKWYNWGLGQPWDRKSRKRYDKLSPLNHADKVETPTLFLCGAKDWNVPILNAELFYQALRVRGIRTQLVVYPEAAHSEHWDDDKRKNGKDYYERILKWLDEFLKVP
jgi:dipeptidyl aminopeptidase/acylaminoacyl peptidase